MYRWIPLIPGSASSYVLDDARAPLLLTQESLLAIVAPTSAESASVGYRLAGICA